MFQGKILAGAMKGSKDYFIDWAEVVKKKFPFKETKKAGSNKLSHGIEKSNKLFEKDKGKSN